jgi:uncharacterized protein YbjT (DUF2867 family)
MTVAAAAGVRHMLYTSIQNPSEDNPAAAAPSHRATEEALRDSGLAWTFLRNNRYAEYQVPVVAQAIASGQLVLTQDGHEGQAYDMGPVSNDVEELTGAPPRSFRDVVAAGVAESSPA